MCPLEGRDGSQGAALPGSRFDTLLSLRCQWRRTGTQKDLSSAEAEQSVQHCASISSKQSSKCDQHISSDSLMRIEQDAFLS
ncbi:hypothetical protein KUCAC02_016540, partial [Chaenocephalus aceratus]